MGKNSLSVEALVNGFVEEICDAKPLAIRIVGSMCREYFSTSTRNSRKSWGTSDIDLHLIVNDLDSLPQQSLDLLQIKIKPNKDNYDVIATKFWRGNRLFSVHVYSISTYNKMCSLNELDIRIFRTSIGKTKFKGYGVDKAIEFLLPMSQISAGYIADYRQKALTGGALYLLPYQSTILTGRYLFDHSSLYEISDGFIKQINRQLIQKEGVRDFARYINILGDHAANLTGGDLLRLRDAYLNSLRHKRLTLAAV